MASAFSNRVKSSNPASRSLMPMQRPENPVPTTAMRMAPLRLQAVRFPWLSVYRIRRPAIMGGNGRSWVIMGNSGRSCSGAAPRPPVQIRRRRNSALRLLVAYLQQRTHAPGMAFRCLDEQPAPEAPGCRAQLCAAPPAQRDQRGPLVGTAPGLLLQGRAQHGQIMVVAKEVAQVFRLLVARLHQLRPDRRQQAQVVAVVFHPLAPLVKIP